MPQKPNRSDAEKRLMRDLVLASAAALLLVRRALGYPPEIGAVNDALLASVNTEYQNALRLHLENTYIEAGMRLSEQGYPVDSEWIEEAAALWVDPYLKTRIRQMSDVTARRLRNTVSAGLAMDAFNERLERIFGAQRMQNIAITEITFAHTAGETEVARRAEQEFGVTMVPVWQTTDDDLVCPTCYPRHQQVILDNKFPPAHAKCRCWINWSTRELR